MDTTKILRLPQEYVEMTQGRIVEYSILENIEYQVDLALDYTSNAEAFLLGERVRVVLGKNVYEYTLPEEFQNEDTERARVWGYLMLYRQLVIFHENGSIN